MSHSSTAKKLWASLYLPELQLDATSTDEIESTPLAIIERRSNRQQIRHCNRAARKAGIAHQMPLNSAYAILPSLNVIEYNADFEATLLQQLGEWAMQYSSIVCLHPPCHLLLEIGASKQLFENFERLIGELQDGLAAMGYHASVGIAPTPLAANVLARAGLRLGTTNLQRLPSLMADLPLQCLELDEKALNAMMRSGIREIDDFLKIPGASLTRRFGPGVSRYMAQLLGQHPDPREPLRARDTFQRKLELPLELEDTQALQFTTQRMINELAGFLIARDSGVNTFEFVLLHHKSANTVLQLRFLQATSQARHLHRVLSERLERTELPEPVTGVIINANRFCEIERDAGDLFIKSRSQQKSPGEVIDQLCSRLGSTSVYILDTVDDHRPEKAWRKRFAETIDSASTRGTKNKRQQKKQNTLVKTKKTETYTASEQWPERPLWLLAEPRLAKQPLQRESDVERIETGWWEEADVRRDYFVARNRRGQRYWVFTRRSKNPQSPTDEIYIHGIFG